MKKITLLIIVLMISTIVFASKTDDYVRSSYTNEYNGNYQVALTNMLAASHLEPNNAFFNLRIGWLYISLGNYQDATTYYAKSYEIDSNFDALQGLLTSYYYLGDWDNTIKTANKVLLVIPKDYLAISKIAYSYYAKGNYAESAKYYGTGYEIYTYNLDAMGYYLSALVESNQLSDAKKIFTKLRKLSPDNQFVKTYESKFK